jgi:NAD(P)H-hydrate repair Nnr-like enzyme with NAD(P)H-hydrate dehydratase domain
MSRQARNRSAVVAGDELGRAAAILILVVEGDSECPIVIDASDHTLAQIAFVPEYLHLIVFAA